MVQSNGGFGSTVNDDWNQIAWLYNHQRNAEINMPFLICECELPGWADDRVSTMYDELYKQ